MILLAAYWNGDELSTLGFNDDTIIDNRDTMLIIPYFGQNQTAGLGYDVKQDGIINPKDFVQIAWSIGVHRKQKLI
jgi:hypothetical protein